MNWEIMEGNWQQAKGRLQEHWGRLIGDDFTMIAGRRQQEAGKLLLRYGLAKQDAERQLLRCQRVYAMAHRRGGRSQVDAYRRVA